MVAYNRGAYDVWAVLQDAAVHTVFDPGLSFNGENINNFSFAGFTESQQG
jgi:hypothetical protein